MPMSTIATSSSPLSAWVQKLRHEDSYNELVAIGVHCPPRYIVLSARNTGWLDGWLVGRLAGRLVDWLVCWLAGPATSIMKGRIPQLLAVETQSCNLKLIHGPGYEGRMV